MQASKASEVQGFRRWIELDCWGDFGVFVFWNKVHCYGVVAAEMIWKPEFLPMSFLRVPWCS